MCTAEYVANSACAIFLQNLWLIKNVFSFSWNHNLRDLTFFPPETWTFLFFFLLAENLFTAW